MELVFGFIVVRAPSPSLFLATYDIPVIDAYNSFKYLENIEIKSM